MNLLSVLLFFLTGMSFKKDDVGDSAASKQSVQEVPIYSVYHPNPVNERNLSANFPSTAEVVHALADIFDILSTRVWDERIVLKAISASLAVKVLKDDGSVQNDNMTRFSFKVNDENEEVSISETSGGASFSVVCLHADSFNRFMKKDLRNYYIHSLRQCKKWNAEGGKSKAAFIKTEDDHFVIKEIQHIEYQTFKKFGVKIMDHIMKTDEPSCLAKIFGVYQVTIGNRVLYLNAMEHITIPRSLNVRCYDLKGTLYKRSGLPNAEPGLDQNFVDDMKKCPFYLALGEINHLNQVLANDTSFLQSLNIMDYSLFVVRDDASRKITCGIIDFFSQYTFCRMLENLYKICTTFRRPTIIPPGKYKNRINRFVMEELVLAQSVQNAPEGRRGVLLELEEPLK